LQFLCFVSYKDLLWLCLIFSANSHQSRPGEAGSGRSTARSPAHDRLKPAVSAINMEHKVIKLGGSKTTGSSSSSKHPEYVQHVHRLKQPAVTESNSVVTSCQDSNLPSANSSRNIRLGQSEHVSVSTADKTESQAVVGLSANMLPAKRTSDSAGETEKKKFKATAITWP